MNRAVFLDRDGVLNANIERDGKQVAPATLAEFRLLPGVADAVAQLKAAEFLTVVVTNQPDVATGRTPLAIVEDMHAILRARMPLDAIKACFHTDHDKCTCRKPLPGMLLEAARELDIDLAASFMVGDRWRDTQAGLAAGCRTIFVDYGHFQEGPHQPNRTVRSLSEAVSFILEYA